MSKTVKIILLCVGVLALIYGIYWAYQHALEFLGFGSAAYATYEAGISAHKKAIEKIIREDEDDRVKTITTLSKIQGAKGPSLIALSRGVFASRN